MTYSRTIEAATLDDLISGAYGPELADVAQDLAIAFSAMPVAQILEACHHSHRLSGQLRQLAHNLSAEIEDRADELDREDREQAREDAAWQCGWDRAGDQMARARAAGQ